MRRLGDGGTAEVRCPVQGRRRPDRSGDRQTDRAGCS
nr:hypothetical protein [Mycobacterium canetti]